MNTKPTNPLLNFMNSSRSPTESCKSDVSSSPATEKLAGGVPRVKRPNRLQMEIQPYSLDELLPQEHEARIVGEFVEDQEFNPLYEKIRAVEGNAGRPAADPKMLLTLWLYATLKGVGSARELERLCADHLAYRWICGGVSVNYHTLADFRADNGDFLDNLLTESVAALIHEGLVDMESVAQDGMRVRASAGAASFRRRETLENCLAEAEEQVRKLRTELESNPQASTQRQKAARERAARERSDRVRKALEKLPEIEARKTAADKDKARASTTDAEANVMKMGDGGFRPAYNVQFATDTKTQIITGVDAVTSGSDQGQLAPMVEQHTERYERVPENALVDGGFTKKEDIEQVTAGGTTVYAPVQKPKDPQRDPHAPRPDDSPTVAEWRVRMGTAEAKEIYKQRAATAECVNALARNRGLQQFRVRGLVKVRAVALLYALVQNLMRAVALRAAAANGTG
jgi:transposase